MLAYQPHCLGNVTQIGCPVGAQAGYVSLVTQRTLNYGTFARRKVKGQAHDFERKQQVGKNYSGVDSTALRDSDRNLGGDLRPIVHLAGRYEAVF
jgi:hypothetical protein